MRYFVNASAIIEAMVELNIDSSRAFAEKAGIGHSTVCNCLSQKNGPWIASNSTLEKLSLFTGSPFSCFTLGEVPEDYNVPPSLSGTWILTFADSERSRHIGRFTQKSSTQLCFDAPTTRLHLDATIDEVDGNWFAGRIRTQTLSHTSRFIWATFSISIAHDKLSGAAIARTPTGQNVRIKFRARPTQVN